MVKQIITYAIVIFGLPIAFSSIIWFFPGAVLAGTVGKSHDKLETIINALIEGIIASTIGVLVFYWLEAKPFWLSLIILSIIVAVWNRTRRENYLFDYSQFAGLLFGYFISVNFLIQ